MRVYSIAEPVFAQSDDMCSLKMDASVHVSDGDMELTPLAGQWKFISSWYVNGHPAGFDIVENLLQSFLDSLFAKLLREELDNYEQKPGGFDVVFNTGLIDAHSGTMRKRRRYVRKVEVIFEVSHAAMTTEELFPELTRLADYAMTQWAAYLRKLAPAVFTRDYAGVKELVPMFRSLQIGLGFESTLPLELAAEGLLCRVAGMRGNRSPPGTNTGAKSRTPKTNMVALAKNQVATVVASESSTRQRTKRPIAVDPALADVTARPETSIWIWKGEFFAKQPYKPRQFVVISETNELCAHTPVFLADCLKPTKRRKTTVVASVSTSHMTPALSQFASQPPSQLMSQSISQSRSQSLSQSRHFNASGLTTYTQISDGSSYPIHLTYPTAPDFSQQP